MPGMTIVGFREHGYRPWYHLAGDTAEHVDEAWKDVLFGWELLQRFPATRPHNGTYFDLGDVQRRRA